MLAAVGAHAGNCEEARKGRDYFANNRQRMRYPEFRARGLCVSTGVVQGACKTLVGSRLKCGGMHWSVDGANDILALRSCIVSDRFDELCHAAAP